MPAVQVGCERTSGSKPSVTASISWESRQTHWPLPSAPRRIITSPEDKWVNHPSNYMGHEVDIHHIHLTAFYVAAGIVFAVPITAYSHQQRTCRWVLLAAILRATFIGLVSAEICRSAQTQVSEFLVDNNLNVPLTTTTIHHNDYAANCDCIRAGQMV